VEKSHKIFNRIIRNAMKLEKQYSQDDMQYEHDDEEITIRKLDEGFGKPIR
jgi:hypothetical protein